MLPGLIDEEVARREADQAYVHQFTESRGAIDPMLLTPLNRGSIYEMSQEWMPDFQANGIETGQIIGGATVVYAGTNEDNTTLVVATRKSVQPRWSKDAGLQNVEYGLTVISYRFAASSRDADAARGELRLPAGLGKTKRTAGY